MKKAKKLIIACVSFAAVLAAAFSALMAIALLLYRTVFARKQPKIASKVQKTRDEEEEKSADDIRHDEQMEKTIEWVYEKDPTLLSIRSFDGLTLRGRLVTRKDDSKKCAILVHGFHGMPERDFAGITQYYYEHGFNVLLVDDRAHGRSEGETLGFGWLDRKDVIAWAKQLVILYGEDCEIVLHGVSMGAAAVMSAGGEEDIPEQVKAIVEDCGFSSTVEQFKSVFPEQFKLLTRPVMKIDSAVSKLVSGYTFEEASPAEQLKKNTKPVLFIHGSEDELVPTKMVYDNYYAAKGPAMLYVCDEAKHARSYAHDPETYEAKLTEFLKKYL